MGSRVAIPCGSTARVCTMEHRGLIAVFAAAELEDRVRYVARRGLRSGPLFVFSANCVQLVPDPCKFLFVISPVFIDRFTQNARMEKSPGAGSCSSRRRREEKRIAAAKHSKNIDGRKSAVLPGQCRCPGGGDLSPRKTSPSVFVSKWVKTKRGGIV